MARTIQEIDIETFVGLKIREYRIMRKMSQGALGKKIGIAFQQVQKYENGTNRVPTSRLFIIAKILNVPMMKFFPDEYQKKIDPTAILYCDKSTLYFAREFRQIKSQRVRALIVNLIRELKGYNKIGGQEQSKPKSQT